jgi:hypothetical protein
MTEFVGVTPPPPGHNLIDFEVAGLGTVDLRNDADLASLCIATEGRTLRITATFVAYSWPDKEIQFTFSGVHVFSVEGRGDFDRGEQMLFDGLEYWVKNNEGGFALDTTYTYWVFYAARLHVTVRHGVSGIR